MFEINGKQNDTMPDFLTKRMPVPVTLPINSVGQLILVTVALHSLVDQAKEDDDRNMLHELGDMIGNLIKSQDAIVAAGVWDCGDPECDSCKSGHSGFTIGHGDA